MNSRLDVVKDWAIGLGNELGLREGTTVTVVPSLASVKWRGDWEIWE